MSVIVSVNTRHETNGVAASATERRIRGAIAPAERGCHEQRLAPPSRRPIAPAGAEDSIDPRKLIAFIAMVFGMFMAILDIQIVSASLSDIQAGLVRQRRRGVLGADGLSGGRGDRDPALGLSVAGAWTRVLFAASAAGFTLASLMCGFTALHRPDDRVARPSRALSAAA